MVTSPVPHSTGVNHLNTHTYLKHLSCAVCFLITGSMAPQFKIGSMVLKTVFCLQDELQMLSVHLGHSWSRSDPPLHGSPTGFCQTDGCCLLQADPDTDHAFAFVHLLFGMFLFLNLVTQYSSLLFPQCIYLSSVSFIPEHPIPPACEPLNMVPGSLPDWASHLQVTGRITLGNQNLQHKSSSHWPEYQIGRRV